MKVVKSKYTLGGISYIVETDKGLMVEVESRAKELTEQEIEMALKSKRNKSKTFEESKRESSVRGFLKRKV